MKVVAASPEIMGGTPVFIGTRVPAQTLIDYLAAGDTVHDFLDDFPTVSREQVEDAMKEGLADSAAVMQP